MGRGTFEKVVEMGEWPYWKHQVLVLSTTLMEDVTENVKVVRSIDEACMFLFELLISFSKKFLHDYPLNFHLNCERT